MSGKRNGRLDLGRLELTSLQKYARKYRLPVSTNSRHELEAQVSKHFNGQQPVHLEQPGNARHARNPWMQFMLDEEEVLINFIRALKNNLTRPKGPAGPYGGRGRG